MLPTTNDASLVYRRYLERHNLESLFKDLMAALLVHQPEDPVSFMKDCLNKLDRAAVADKDPSKAEDGLKHSSWNGSILNGHQSDDFTSPQVDFSTPHQESDHNNDDGGQEYEENEDEDDTASDKQSPGNPLSLSDRFRASQQAIEAAHSRGRRGSVSGESIQPADEAEERLVIPKSNTAKMRIASAIASNLLFQNMDSDQRHEVVDAMFERKVAAGEVVIQQGEEGDNFYVVDEGSFEVIINDIKVIDVGAGGSFGELALMYNTPRAATVKATSDSILWGVDRVTFRRSVTNYSFRKRKMYESFLKTVSILQKLEPSEIVKLSDALEPVDYSDGEEIIEQGDEGNYFYIIERGEVTVTRTDEEFNVHNHPSLSAGDYFGELALLHNAPRAATITAKGDVRVAALAKDAFVRLLGPVVDVMKRRTMSYSQFDQAALEQMLRNGGHMDDD